MRRIVGMGPAAVDQREVGISHNEGNLDLQDNVVYRCRLLWAPKGVGALAVIWVLFGWAHGEEGSEALNGCEFVGGVAG